MQAPGSPQKVCNENESGKNDKIFLIEGSACGKLVSWISNDFISTILDTMKVRTICLVNE